MYGKAMDASAAQYFDYLDEYGDALQQKLGNDVNLQTIDFWRRSGSLAAEAIAVGCRNFAEHALNALAHNDPKIAAMDFKFRIINCEKQGSIPKTIALKLHEIRKKGNKGAHSSIVYRDACLALELLDDLLRYLLRTSNIAPDIPLEANRNLDTIVITDDQEENEKLKRDSRTAAQISGDKTLESQAHAVIKKKTRVGRKEKTLLKKALDLDEQLEKEVPGGATQLESGLIKESQLASLDSEFDTLKREKKAVKKETTRVRSRVDAILSEQDYIAKLLKAKGDKGQATDAQFKVMLFPRSERSTTNMLMLNGAAGTGKTLCLLAKLIADVRTDGMLQLEGLRQKRALFVCFNKSLKEYVKGILGHFGEGALPIEVTHYDEFVNQLVRKRPKDEYRHLAGYAPNVRYDGPPFWSVFYGGNDNPYLVQAMQQVAERYPDQRNAYYLNSSYPENLKWLGEEIRWLDARYASFEDAVQDYPTTARIGRGTKHLPNAAIRQVILEVWKAYDEILQENRQYTVEQTTKRLMGAENLPLYDSIAIDEVQDFTMASVRLILRMRASDQARIYIAGDENQKIYQRDFTWKELGQNTRGYTITLTENMRNSDAIRRFAERLNGAASSFEDSKHLIHIENRTDEQLLDLIQTLLDRPSKRQKTVLIGNVNNWKGLLKSRRIEVNDASEGKIDEPGMYVMSEFIGKGLEFDNVIVDYDHVVGEDPEGEKRLRYVHFTRARLRLYIRYAGEPPQLLKDYYPDFLADAAAE